MDRLSVRDLASLLRSLTRIIASIAACVAVASAGSSALPSRAFGQVPAGAGESETAPNAEPRAPSVSDLEMMPRATRRAREASLVAVLAARRQVEADLRALQAELQSESARGRETELERQIQARAADVAGLSRSFSELATGVDPLALGTEPEPTQFELTSELRVLLSPLINELKRATSRPREIDRLRTEIADLGDQMATIDKALAQLDAVSAASKDAALLKALGSERRDWARRRTAIETTLEVTEHKLDQRAADSQSITETIHSVFQLFFKSRGRNLLFSVIATVAFLLVLLRIRTFVGDRRSSSKSSPTFRGRILSLAYSIFTVVGTVVVFITALYFVGDWVLLTIALLLLLGLVWASKQALPRFWSQAVLILDMGAVREGQRVIWNGIAWRVESIAFYCVLSNPALTGGRIRIPIDDLASFRSRPSEEEEPWFPTRAGDVLLLEDGRPAVVEFQSTEIVRLRVPGGNRIVVPTTQFAARSLEVLSYGYRVDLEFGLDYQKQAEITTTDRELMQVEVERRWRESSWARSLVGVAVEFNRAGPSSLDYFVRVDLDGSQASEFAAQRRHLARICVDVCNEHGWMIPFQQVMVHMADPGED